VPPVLTLTRLSYLPARRNCVADLPRRGALHGLERLLSVPGCVGRAGPSVNTYVAAGNAPRDLINAPSTSAVCRSAGAREVVEKRPRWNSSA